MNKKTDYLFYAFSIAITVFILHNTYQAFYPYRTLVVNNVTTQKSYQQNDTLYYQIDYCKYTDKPATVSRTLHSVDNLEVIPFPLVSTITLPGCRTANVPLQLYSTIKPGTYYVLIDASFHINPQRDMHVVFKTNNFEIMSEKNI